MCVRLELAVQKVDGSAKSRGDPLDDGLACIEKEGSIEREQAEGVYADG